MRALLDTSVWYQFSRNLPLPQSVQNLLEDASTNAFLSAISTMEIARKWSVGKLPCPDPSTWLDDALEGFIVIPVSEPIARQAALWPWEHRDPADRIIAATAQITGIELWHSDRALKELSGFPQRYFKSVM